MNNFCENYSKAREVIANQKFEKDWEEFLAKKCSIAKLFGEKGFSRAQLLVPDLVRAKISKIAKEKKIKSGEVIIEAARNGTSPGALSERAAFLKLVKHLHLAAQKGGQAVWVYSPPKKHTSWIFDEITGPEPTIKSKLNEDKELFSLTEMKWMSGALAIALKVSEDTKIKLARKKLDKRTGDTIKRWFLDGSCTDAQTTTAAEKLLAGFKKIAVACNANTLVFTDYPDWRAKRDKYFGGAVPGGEGKFPVIYLEGAFTRLTGNTGKQWLCVETIVHEMSHHEVSTEDKRYDHQGLRPSASFPFADAIANADSWGYFALDLAGYLSKADFQNVWK
jgi:hypothetical protein